ncbi:MAG: NADAR family protein [Bacteroidales bacterium]|nr:NADAR family protein [Bacteroidales bacterium]
MKSINQFRGYYRFLSNFWPCDIDFAINKNKLITFPSVEHFYQAMKSKRTEDWIRICNLPKAGDAKREGQKIKLRDDWEEVKLEIMEIGLKIKFSHSNLKLLRMLLETGDLKIIEGNYWHDNFWGDCFCSKCENIKGKNNLGKLLMRIRDFWRE